MAANNLGTAYIKIAPQMDGIQSAISKQLQSAAKSTSIGASSIALGETISKGISKVISTVTNSLEGAIRRTDIINNFSKVMSNMGVSAQESQESIDKLVKKLDGLPTALQDGASAVQRFTSKNGDIQKSTDIFLALNNAILAGAAPAELQATAIEQISQAYAKGKPDMMEWRSMLSAMPAQLNQIAQKMGYGANGATALGEALRKGEVSMDDFMDAIIELNTNGADGFKSFEEQARNSTDGIGTAMKNVNNRIEAALQKVINAFGSKDIASAINKFSSSFSGIADWLVQNVVPVIKNTVIPAIRNVFSVIKSIVEYISQNQWVQNVLMGILNTMIAFKAITAVKNAITGVITPIVGMVSNLGSAVTAFKSAWSAGMSFSSAMGNVAANTTGLTSVFAGITSKVGSFVSALGPAGVAGVAGLAAAGILGVQAAIIGSEIDTIRATTSAREYARAHYSVQQAAESAKKAEDLLKQSINDLKTAEDAATNAEIASIQARQNQNTYLAEMNRLKAEGKQNTDEYRLAELNYTKALAEEKQANEELKTAQEAVASEKANIDNLNSSGLYKANLVLASLMREGEEYGTLAAKLDELKTKTITYKDEHGNMVEANLQKSQEMAAGIAEQLANSETKTGEVWRHIVDIANTEGISYAEAAARYGSEAGNNITGNFAEGVRLNTSLVTNATKESGQKAIDKMKSSISGAYDVGKNITQGAANGINDASATGSLWGRAASVISTAIAKMKAAAQEHSPSKATAEIGKFLSLGLAKGIDDYADEAVLAAQNATEAALGAFSVSDTSLGSVAPYSASDGLVGGNNVTQYNTFNVDSELDVKDVSKRLGWQVATAL